MVHGATLLPEPTRALVQYTYFSIYQMKLMLIKCSRTLHRQLTGQFDWSVTEWVSAVLVWFGDRDHSCCSLMNMKSPEDQMLSRIFWDLFYVSRGRCSNRLLEPVRVTNTHIVVVGSSQVLGLWVLPSWRFNDDTRPQRHISRLPQVEFSQLFMLYKQITRVQWCQDVVIDINSEFC